MEVIPSISFRQEWPVTVSDGAYRPLVGDDGYKSVKEMMGFLKSDSRIYLLDIDAIEYNRLQTEVIRRLGIWKDVWADVGPRDIATITDAYIAGADRVVVSTKRMPSLELLEEAVTLSDRIVFTVDYRDGVISPSKEVRELGVEKLVDKALEMGVDTLVILDLSEGTFDHHMLGNLPEGEHSLYVGGNYIREAMIPPGVKGLILGFKEVVERQRRD